MQQFIKPWSEIHIAVHNCWRNSRYCDFIVLYVSQSRWVQWETTITTENDTILQTKRYNFRIYRVFAVQCAHYTKWISFNSRHTACIRSVVRCENADRAKLCSTRMLVLNSLLNCRSARTGSPVKYCIHYTCVTECCVTCITYRQMTTKRRLFACTKSELCHWI